MVMEASQQNQQTQPIVRRNRPGTTAKVSEIHVEKKLCWKILGLVEKSEIFCCKIFFIINELLSVF